jgi:DNA polymerase V
VTAGRLIPEDSLTSQKEAIVQFNLFDNLEARVKQEEADQRVEKREKSLQQAMLSIRHRFGKNAILKAANLKKEARTIARNGEIGGHKA